MMIHEILDVTLDYAFFQVLHLQTNRYIYCSKLY